MYIFVAQVSLYHGENNLLFSEMLTKLVETFESDNIISVRRDDNIISVRWDDNNNLTCLKQLWGAGSASQSFKYWSQSKPPEANILFNISNILFCRVPGRLSILDCSFSSLPHLFVLLLVTHTCRSH